eukprot:GFYU01008405.1.p1 GENE.GFYU01008405.1~~GFYU01008405.1.p1  ORF type:complete len:477 (+),score=116.98 GFYU01008405.1:72-1433(+)
MSSLISAVCMPPVTPVLAKTSNTIFRVVLQFVFLDLFAVALVIPLLPFLATELGASPRIYGLLGSTYGVTQLMGSVAVGKLSDKYGRRFVLLLSFLGTGISYFITGSATSLFFLFLGRIPVGLLKQTVSVANTVVTDVTDASSRGQYFAWVKAAVDVGFIVGPLIGGYTSKAFSISVVFYLAASLFIFNSIMVYFSLPETKHFKATPTTKSSKSAVSSRDEPEGDNEDSTLLQETGMGDRRNQPVDGADLESDEEETAKPPPVSTMEMLKTGTFMRVLSVRLVMDVAYILFDSMMSLYLVKKFHIDTSENGKITSFNALINVFANGILVPYLTHRSDEKTLIKVGFVTFAVGILVLGFSPTLPVFIVCLPMYLCSYAVLATATMMLFTRVIPQTNMGVALGLAGSIESVCRIIGPLLGGFLLNDVSLSAPALASASMLLGLSLVLPTILQKLT